MSQGSSTFRLFIAGLGCAALPTAAEAPATSEKRPLSELPHTPSLEPGFMDRSFDPCVDFYALTCGNWSKINPIPPGLARRLTPFFGHNLEPR